MTAYYGNVVIVLKLYLLYYFELQLVCVAGFGCRLTLEVFFLFLQSIINDFELSVKYNNCIIIYYNNLYTYLVFVYGVTSV